MAGDAELSALSQRVGIALQQQGLRLSCAESCTGGWLSKVITDIPGSSAYFDRGFVTYTNESKQDLLGVDAETLQRDGAVSAASVEAMARGALLHSRATLAVAVSGIAGPAGGSVDKPIGLVWFCWVGVGREAVSDHQHFAGDRGAVRRQAVAYALQGMLRVLGAD